MVSFSVQNGHSNISQLGLAEQKSPIWLVKSWLRLKQLANRYLKCSHPTVFARVPRRKAQRFEAFRIVSLRGVTAFWPGEERRFFGAIEVQIAIAMAHGTPISRDMTPGPSHHGEIYPLKQLELHFQVAHWTSMTHEIYCSISFTSYKSCLEYLRIKW